MRHERATDEPRTSSPEWQTPQTCVCAVNPQDDAVANRLADRLKLPLQASTAASGECWKLLVDGSRLTLVRPDSVKLHIDFTRGKTAARQREPGRLRQPLARALGIARLRKRLGHEPRIVDATGGLGRDAWFAASLGCPVTLLERSPLVHALLDAALVHARNDAVHAETARRIDLHNVEAIEHLVSLPADTVDVIYLDPMYPPTRRRAAVTKGMQFLHELLGPDGGNDGLLRAALAAAAHQVTVKRPAGASRLAGAEAFEGQLTTVESPSTRYDIFLKI